MAFIYFIYTHTYAHMHARMYIFIYKQNFKNHIFKSLYLNDLIARYFTKILIEMSKVFSLSPGFSFYISHLCLKYMRNV